MSENTALSPINDTTVESILTGAAKPAVIFLTSHLIGHCTLMRPRVEAAAAEFGQQIDFYEAKAEDSVKIIASFGVRAAPALMLFRGTQLVGIRLGLQTQDAINEFMLSAVTKQ